MEDLQEWIKEVSKAYSGSVIEDEFNPLRKYTIDDLMEEMEFAFEQGANFILSKWQESERWRKVEEELPEVGIKVLVRTNKNSFIVAEMYIPKDCKGNILGGKEWKGSYHFKNSIIEWKPIK